MSKYAGPTKDGQFKGTKIECAICGNTFRRNEMVKQKDYLVCRKYCFDDIAHEAKPKGNTFN